MKTELGCSGLCVLLTIMFVCGCGHRGKAVKEEETAIPMTCVDPVSPPLFNGKDANEFTPWLYEHLGYPEAALEDAVVGRLSISFTVDTLGNICDVKVLRGVHPAIDAEVVRAVSSSPRWTPSMNRKTNEPVSRTFVYPVFFTQSLLMRPFIVKMYEKRLYEDYGFLRNHCTPELLKKLSDAYPYDSDGEAYAVWMFRSGFQDGDSDEYRIIEVALKDSETCTYRAIDMGHEFTRTLKFTTEGNRILMSDIF